MSTTKPTAAESAKIVRAIAENASLRWFHGNEERHWAVGVNELPDGDVDAALHAAAEALDRRDGLVFGPPVGESHLRCAVSVDGHLYQIRDDATGEDEPCEDIVEWMHVKSGDGDTNVVGVEKAIKQARAHDATRRGGR